MNAIPCLLAASAFALLASSALVAAPPPEGVAVLPADTVGAFTLMGEAGAATMETIPVEGQEFTKALRVKIAKPAGSAWAIQLHAKSTAAVEKGDALLATFWLRSAEAASGEALTAFVFELGKEPYSKSIECQVTADRKWHKLSLPFASVGSYAPGEASINFQLGFAAQTVEIAGVQLVNYGKKVKVADLPRSSFGYAGSNADAPWRAAAAERIEKLRKGDLAVVVKDAAGKPIEGAAVKVRQARHAFGFGSAIASDRLLAESPDGEKYRDTVKRLFNKIVFENDLKWGDWAWENPANRPKVPKALDWLDRQHIEARGHCLVWPAWGNMPADLKKLAGDRPALEKRIAAHVREEVGALKGRLVEWDVINEPYSNHDVMDICGNDVMADWFRIAHEADPKPVLFINDYSILSSGGRDTAHQAHYEKTIRFLLEKGAPLGGIGLQSHFDWALTPPPKLLEILDRFGSLGPEIELEATEFDIDITDEALQAAYLRDFMTTLFSHPKVKGIIMWGFWEGHHWKPSAALFRKDWSVKPNGQAWIDLVTKTWWTSADGKTAASGDFKTRGFLGEYDVTVEANGKTKTVRAQLPKDGATLAVTMD